MDPYQTLTQDINRLLTQKESRDDKGKALPKGLSKGEVSWWTYDAKRVTGRLIQTDTSDNMVENFSCYGQVVLCQTLANATPASGLVGTNFNFYASLFYCVTNYGGTSQCSGPNSSSAGSPSYSWNIYGAFQSATSSNYNASSMSVAPGNGTATVTATSGMCTQSGSAPVQVTGIPYADPVISNTYNGKAPASECPSASSPGWERTVNKQIVDKSGNSIQVNQQSISETYDISSSNNGLYIGKINTGTATTNSSGQLPDDYYVCSTVCKSGNASTQATQHPTDTLPGGQAYKLQDNAIVYSCTGITVNGK